VTYKVFAKILYDRLLPNENAAVQHYQAGFQSGKSTTDQLFALRQILENAMSLTSQRIIYSKILKEKSMKTANSLHNMGVSFLKLRSYNSYISVNHDPKNDEHKIQNQFI
jgi:hypothetical protein